jgi:hypothetical protein
MPHRHPIPRLKQTRVGGTFVAHANVFAGFARAFVYALTRTAVNAPQVCNLHRQTFHLC